MNAHYSPATAELNHWLHHARQNFPALCQARDADSHKGSHGTLAIIGGSCGMSGALVLAGSAALKNGCGKVWLGFFQATLPLPLLPLQPEIMLATATDLEQRTDITTWAIGCGLGTSSQAAHYLNRRLSHNTECPLLLDADALNLLAEHSEWPALLQNRHRSAILTPHPAEAARLLQCPTRKVQAQREAAAVALVQRFHCTVVLKGRHTLIASPDGRLTENHSGNPGLATAGSGDVLTGIIAALLAQGIAADEAAAGGVWLHGAAADVLVAAGKGPIGLTAGELADAARWLRNRITV